MKLRRYTTPHSTLMFYDDTKRMPRHLPTYSVLVHKRREIPPTTSIFASIPIRNTNKIYEIFPITCIPTRYRRLDLFFTHDDNPILLGQHGHGWNMDEAFLCYSKQACVGFCENSNFTCGCHFYLFWHVLIYLKAFSGV